MDIATLLLMLIKNKCIYYIFIYLHNSKLSNYNILLLYEQ